MPATTACANCYATKTPDRYGEYYCLDCQKARDEAILNDSDPRAALASRVPNAHSNDSRTFFERFNGDALASRQAIEPGSPYDPRMGR